jgi:hypothetical protein
VTVRAIRDEIAARVEALVEREGSVAAAIHEQSGRSIRD